MDLNLVAMRKKIRNRMIRCYAVLVATIAIGVLVSMMPRVRQSQFPFAAQGLSEREAAAHLLSRFTYGAGPAQIDAVVKQGLERWFDEQLKGTLPEDKLDALLRDNDACRLTNTQIVETYVRGGQLARMAIRDGAIAKDSLNLGDKKEDRKKLADYATAHHLKPERELIRQFTDQKIWRALYTTNQLREVMTDFWFNHFNVSFTKANCSLFIPAYERDVIRPNALGKFGSLLLATARSPAMLMYLDNFSSAAENSNRKRMMDTVMQQKPRRVKGLNENYAREVMELHTLGVDGGYTQQDVTEAARVLTGWTVYPIGKESPAGRRQIERLSEEQLRSRGFVHDGDFLFTPNRHDQGEKTVLAKRFNGGGYAEGETLLALLADHPSTARFISRKLAIRFVSDDPPPALVERMAATFTASHGDIRAVLTTMAYAPEFWSAQAVRMKTKSPFEVVISAVRSLHADVTDPAALTDWVNRMGQKIYYYQAPTGFPDRSTYWINTGSLLSRMNFGLALATTRVRGITYDALALNHQHEPESAEDALLTYTHLILPGRKTDETIKRLTPLLNDPELSGKVDKAASENPVKSTVHSPPSTVNAGNSTEDTGEAEQANESKIMGKPAKTYKLDQVIGIIIGSPEFQRR